jgi:hypothetical protein
MIKIGFVVLILIASFFPVSAQESKKPFIYQINAVYNNADLDERAIDKYKKRDAEWGEPREVLKLFKPVKGKYKIIIFAGAVYGLSATDDKEDIFHNLLILKVNKNNEILDGLQYILEWAEPPTASRLCRIAKSGIKLQKGLPVSQLGCRNFETARVIPLGGVLDNLYNFQEIF